MDNAFGFIGLLFKDEPSMARFESGDRKRHIIACYQNLREYECSNQTLVTRLLI